MISRENAINKKTKNKKKYTLLGVFKKILFWFVFFGFCAVLIWTIIFSPVMKIKEVEIIGAAEDEANIRDVVKKDMSGKYFDFIPKDNLLIFPLKKIKAEVQENFIMIRTTSIERKFPAKIIIKIERREKTIVWCAKDDCWLVDENAEAFYKINKEDAKRVDGDVLVTDGREKSIEKGDKVASVETINLCNNLPMIMRENSDIEIDNKSLYIPSPVSGEIRAKTNTGWEIYFSTERSLDRQVEILEKVLTAKISSVDVAQLEYFDLRLKGKVVYRFKDYMEREKEVEEVQVQGATTEKTAETEIKKEETKKDTKKEKNK